MIGARCRAARAGWAGAVRVPPAKDGASAGRERGYRSAHGPSPGRGCRPGVALVAVMVVPSLAGRRTAGSAVAVALPDPPQVGDCLLAPITQSLAPGGWPRDIPYSEQSFGSCAAARERARSWPSGTPRRQADEAARSRLGGPCYRQAAAFAGLVRSGRSTILPGGAADAQVSWKPTIGFAPYRIVPGEVEQNAGRSWTGLPGGPARTSRPTGAACGTPTRPATWPMRSPCVGRATISTPSRRCCPAINRTRRNCWPPGGSGIVRRCPGRTSTRPASTWRPASCTPLTPPGRVRSSIVVDPFRLDGASTPDAPLSVNCFVTSAGTQQLTGTVIGLGARPIPFEQ